MYSISKLCKASGLSRSTLLYYDSVGLLKPSGRTASNYRFYSEDDKVRLEQICLYREAGISLEQIKTLLDSGGNDNTDVLTKRLSTINNEIHLLRLQQKIVVTMLKQQNNAIEASMLDSNGFMSILKTSGISDEALNQLHLELEKRSPEEHQAFLEFLGLDERDIRYIREWAKSAMIQQ